MRIPIAAIVLGLAAAHVPASRPLWPEENSVPAPHLAAGRPADVVFQVCEMCSGFGWHIRVSVDGSVAYEAYGGEDAWPQPDFFDPEFRSTVGCDSRFACWLAWGRRPVIVATIDARAGEWHSLLDAQHGAADVAKRYLQRDLTPESATGIAETIARRLAAGPVQVLKIPGAVLIYVAEINRFVPVLK